MFFKSSNHITALAKGAILPFFLVSSISFSNSTLNTSQNSCNQAEIPAPQKFVDSEDINATLRLDYGSHGFVNSIHHKDASFIKVNFKLNLPAGDYLTVCNKEKSECHRYPDQTGFTPASDGSIWALSIEGDSAELELHSDGSSLEGYSIEEQKKFGIEVIGYERGFSNKRLGLTKKAEPCGKDDKQPVECWKDKYPDIYKIIGGTARFRSGGSCTSWRVGEDKPYIMTNNHCVKTQDGVARSEIQFNYRLETCGGSKNTQMVKVAGRKMLKTSPFSGGLDFTLLDIHDFDKVEKFGHYDIEPRKIKRNERLFMIHHPQAHPKKGSIEDDKNKSGFCRADTFRGIRINYYCDTEGGSSGSPVFLFDEDGDHRVAAIHHVGVCYNGGVKMELIYPEVKEFLE